MKRFINSKRQEERDEIAEISEISGATLLETDETTVKKLVDRENYDRDDILKCVKDLLKEYKHNYEEQFFLLENMEDFQSVFQDLEIETDVPVWVIFRIPEQCWVPFCILQKTTRKYRILYRDPSGQPIHLEMKDKLIEKINNVEFFVNVDDQKTKMISLMDVFKGKKPQFAEAWYGPVTLRNLKIMLEWFEKDARFFHEYFFKIEFVGLKELEWDIYRVNLITKLIYATVEIFDEEEFITLFRKYIDNESVDVGSDMLEYKEMVEKEMKNDAGKIDFKKIDEARKEFINTNNKETFEENYKMNKKTLDDVMKSYTLLWKEFPNQMQKIDFILEALENVKVDEQLFEALRSISAKLGIDYYFNKRLFK